MKKLFIVVFISLISIIGCFKNVEDENVVKLNLLINSFQKNMNEEIVGGVLEGIFVPVSGQKYSYEYYSYEKIVNLLNAKETQTLLDRVDSNKTKTYIILKESDVRAIFWSDFKKIEDLKGINSKDATTLEDLKAETIVKDMKDGVIKKADGTIGENIYQDSIEKTKLLTYLNSLKGIKTLSGEHEFNFDNMSYMGAVAGITGKYPAVYETELAMTAGESPARAVELRNYVVEKSIKWWNQGGIVALTWHECLPGSDIQDFAHSQAKCTQEEFNQIVTPGTAEYNLLLGEIDEIAIYLKKLKEANVPILWRPYHEMNGGWFWWGDKTNYATLWNILYDRLVKYHKLNNLIWVFSPNARQYNEIKPYGTFYPGHSKVDMLSEDVYVGNNTEFKQSWQDELVTLAEGRPVAWAECGTLPTSAQLNGIYSNTVWFSCWRQFLTESNSCSQIADLYSDNRIITRDEVPRLYAKGYVPIIYPPDKTPTLPESGNIVKNPGFELGSVNWGLGIVYSLDSSDKHSGLNSIKLTGRSSWDNLLQNPIPCTPHTNYKCSFWAKSTTSYLTLRVYNAEWTAKIDSIDTTPNGVWTKYSLNFNSLYFTALMVDFTDSSGGISYIDDIEIIPEGYEQTIPESPSNLKAVEISSEQINITWKDNSTNETGFNIETSINGIDFVKKTTVFAGITNFSSSGLKENSVYYYRVSAFNEKGSSTYSNVISCLTTKINTQVGKYEAENGVLVGVEKQSITAGFSGTGYVSGFDNSTDSLTIDVNAEDAVYNMTVGYSSGSEKKCVLLINNNNIGEKILPLSAAFGETYFGQIKLNAGNNKITIQNGWGWYYIDYIKIEKVTAVSATLTSIAITKQPTKINYIIGESVIDTTGLVVTGNYSDGTTRTEAITSGAISGFNTTTSGTKIITVAIEGKKATFNIMVTDGITRSSIAANNANIQYYGRWDFTNPTSARINWGDAYIVTKFQGTSIGVKIADLNNWYAYSIDGAEFVKFQMPGTVYYITGLKDVTHSLTLIRRTEGGNATVFNGFELDNGKTVIAPNAKPIRKIEFVGDSITAGLNNENSIHDSNLAIYQNSYMSYGPQLARLLNAEHRAIAISGIAVSLPNGRHMIDDYTRKEATQWDFKLWQPDAVVMLMGDNDISGGKLQSTDTVFKNEYSLLLDLIRSKNPNAHIICLVPFNGNNITILMPLITDIVTAKKDSKIHIININAEGTVVKSTDYADFSHPLISGHTKLANYLAPKITKILGW